MKQTIDIKYDVPTKNKIAQKGFKVSGDGVTSDDLGFPNLAI